MKLCKYAFNQVRSSSEIFRGFGFKHLSDATQYYVHAISFSPKIKNYLQCGRGCGTIGVRDFGCGRCAAAHRGCA